MHLKYLTTRDLETNHHDGKKFIFDTFGEFFGLVCNTIRFSRKKYGRKFMTRAIIFHSFHSEGNERHKDQSFLSISYGFVTIEQRLSIAADLTTCETVVYLLFSESVVSIRRENLFLGRLWGGLELRGFAIIRPMFARINQIRPLIT